MDVTDAPTQDAIAESLLPETEQQAEEPVAEQPVETDQEAQTVEQEQQELQPETDPNWLPNEQDKVFSDDVYARYGERYGLSAEQAQDPLVRQLLHDKINSDIWISQQQQFAEQEYREPEAVRQPEQQQPTQPQITREQYFAQLDRAIAERTDPAIAKEFHDGFLRAFGVPETEISKASPQQAMAVTTLMSKYALNLFNTFADDMLSSRLQNQISSAYPGFGDMYERSAYAMSWDNVRNSNPAYGALPAYGTKEFSQKLREASARIPGFDEMQFTDAQNKPLPMMENAQRKYTMLAQIASGQNVDPRLVQQAAATGARNARRADVRRAAGNLGSGQSKGGSSREGQSSQFQTNQDIFDDETISQLNTRL
jgi:hypothetical protein